MTRTTLRLPYHSVRVLNGLIRLLVMHLGANINIPAHNTAFGKAQSQWWNPKGEAEGGKAYAPIGKTLWQQENPARMRRGISAWLLERFCDIPKPSIRFLVMYAPSAVWPLSAGNYAECLCQLSSQSSVRSESARIDATFQEILAVKL